MNQKKIGKPSNGDVNGWLDAIFGPASLGKETEHFQAAAVAFQNLTFYFLHEIHGKNPARYQALIKCIQFNHVGVMSTMKRFQRDVYGVRRFFELMGRMVDDGRIRDKETQDEICSEVCSLGLRITAPEPRKTRVPASFTLWMNVFRPVFLTTEATNHIPIEDVEEFCASFTFFLTSSYLSKFGYIELGNNASEIAVRIKRIKHDFTCRDVGMSSLETFYSSIFKLDSRFEDPPSQQD